MDGDTLDDAMDQIDNRVGLEDAYYNLANAIIIRAVTDFKEAILMNNKAEKTSIEKFFKSEYYSMLTNVPYTVFIQ